MIRNYSNYHNYLILTYVLRSLNKSQQFVMYKCNKKYSNKLMPGILLNRDNFS